MLLSSIRSFPWLAEKGGRLGNERFGHVNDQVVLLEHALGDRFHGCHGMIVALSPQTGPGMGPDSFVAQDSHLKITVTVFQSENM